jgi:hypothetical protein
LLCNRLSGNGQNLALRQKPVPHKTLAALVVQKVDVTCHEFRHLRAHSRRQKLLRTRTQKIRQRFNNAMTDHQPSSSRQSHSQQPLSFGYEP